MKNWQYSWKILFFLLATGFASHAQSGYSYFYFEGDQQTPFYVKVEGKMQPRLGKNHFIIPNLDAGYTHFQILFQKNEFPPQDFLLEVPKGGSRSFVLHQVNERQFALYDLQQKRYIIAGNKQEDDHATASVPAATLERSVRVTDTDLDIPVFAPDEKKTRIDKKTGTVSSVVKTESRFLNGIELNSDSADGSGVTDADIGEPVAVSPTTGKKNKRQSKSLDDLPAIKNDLGEEVPPGPGQSELPPVPNTDCPQAMSNEEFEDFALRVLDRSTDDERLKFIRKVKDKHCFSTEQVRILANNLSGQSARYEAVKILYFHTSDQENYKKLEALFNTDFLKSKFREIINP